MNDVMELMQALGPLGYSLDAHLFISDAATVPARAVRGRSAEVRQAIREHNEISRELTVLRARSQPLRSVVPLAEAVGGEVLEEVLSQLVELRDDADSLADELDERAEELEDVQSARDLVQKRRRKLALSAGADPLHQALVQLLKALAALHVSLTLGRL